MSKITLVKGDSVKFQDNDKFLVQLKAEGWSVEGEEKTEYEQLKDEADALELEYAGNISKADLKKLIKAAK